MRALIVILSTLPALAQAYPDELLQYVGMCSTAPETECLNAGALRRDMKVLPSGFLVCAPDPFKMPPNWFEIWAIEAEVEMVPLTDRDLSLCGNGEGSCHP